MTNDIFLARLFLIGLVVIGIYTGVSEKAPDEVLLIPCIFRSVTHIPCPGCGMTRACLALTQGHFTEAWHYHPLSFLIVSLAIGVSFFDSQLKNVWTRCSLNLRNSIAILGITLCLSIWIIKIKGLF